MTGINKKKDYNPYIKVPNKCGKKSGKSIVDSDEDEEHN